MFVELKEKDGKTYLVHYDITPKNFDCFKNDYNTNKWVSLENWYRIEERIYLELEKNGKLETGEVSWKVDNLTVTLTSHKAEKNFPSCLKHDRLLKVKITDQIYLDSSVSRLSLEYEPEIPTPEPGDAETLMAKYNPSCGLENQEIDEYCIPEAEDSPLKYKPQAKNNIKVPEYVPNNLSAKETNGNTYVPSKQQSSEVNEYIPCSSSTANVKYIPSKIKQTGLESDDDMVENSEDEQENKTKYTRSRRKTEKPPTEKSRSQESSKKIRTLFGSEDDEDHKSKPLSKTQSDPIEISSQTDDESQPKRQKLERDSKHRTQLRIDEMKNITKSSSKERSRDKEPSKKDQKKRKDKDKDKEKNNKDTPTTNVWINTSKRKEDKKLDKPSSSSDRLKMLQAEGEQMRKKDEEFKEKYHNLKKSMEEFNSEQGEKKKRLKYLKVLKCSDFSNQILADLIDEFSEMIENKITVYKAVSFCFNLRKIQIKINFSIIISDSKNNCSIRLQSAGFDLFKNIF
jgi:hypothetical protein